MVMLASHFIKTKQCSREGRRNWAADEPNLLQFRDLEVSKDVEDWDAVVELDWEI